MFLSPTQWRNFLTVEFNSVVLTDAKLVLCKIKMNIIEANEDASGRYFLICDIIYFYFSSYTQKKMKIES